MTHKGKQYFNLLVIVLMLVILGFLLNELLKPKQNEILIHFLDVGQGDATLIEMPQGQKILIDGGPNDSVVSSLDKIIPFYQRKIDAIILTHPHADHTAGLINVLEDFKVKDFYMTGVFYTSPEYRLLSERLTAKNIPTHKLQTGDTFDFGNNIKITILYPKQVLKDKKIDNLNNSSIVAKVIWGKSSALFTGDIEKDEQSQILDEDLKTDLLKIPHHCSNDAINTGFIKKAMPKYSVIFVGKDNPFGHPTTSCLNVLKESQIYRTDYDGNVNFQMSPERVTPI